MSAMSPNSDAEVSGVSKSADFARRIDLQDAANRQPAQHAAMVPTNAAGAASETPLPILMPIWAII
jgi:hypothetical protein